MGHSPGCSAAPVASDAAVDSQESRDAWGLKDRGRPRGQGPLCSLGPSQGRGGVRTGWRGVLGKFLPCQCPGTSVFQSSLSQEPSRTQMPTQPPVLGRTGPCRCWGACGIRGSLLVCAGLSTMSSPFPSSNPPSSLLERHLHSRRDRHGLIACLRAIVGVQVRARWEEERGPCSCLVGANTTR